MEAKVDECRQGGLSSTKRPAEESLAERKRKQSRESTRRWRANELSVLEALRNQVTQLETELKSKLSVGGSAAQVVPLSSDARIDKLMAAKRFYVAQNMQLLEAIKLRQDRLSSIVMGQVTMQPSLYDDAFLMYMTHQTQEKLHAMDLRSQFQGAVREINGISCIALTRGHSMDYNMQKYYTGVNHLIMGDFAWAAYQEKSMFMPLVDRVIDHRVIRRVHANMLVIETKAWTVERVLQQRFLVLQRERSPQAHTVTVTALASNLALAPHAFWYCLHPMLSHKITAESCSFGASNITSHGFLSRATGTCCLMTGSPEEAKVTIEGMVHAQCRLEAYVRANSMPGLPLTSAS